MRRYRLSRDFRHDDQRALLLVCPDGTAALDVIASLDPDGVLTLSGAVRHPLSGESLAWNRVAPGRWCAVDGISALCVYDGGYSPDTAVVPHDCAVQALHAALKQLDVS